MAPATAGAHPSAAELAKRVTITTPAASISGFGPGLIGPCC